MKKQIYTTVRREYTILFEEKKSIFHAACKRVENVAEAEVFLQERRNLYPDANHHVYAWVIGGKGEQEYKRFSDDGEPHGTSGPPIFDVLVKRNITDTIIVVSRYFGGTLLGTGGLVKAYGQSASLLIEEAGLSEMLLAYAYTISFPYRFVDALTHRLALEEISLVDKQFSSEVEFTCMVEDEKVEPFLAMVQELCLGQAQVTKGDLAYLERVWKG